MMLTAQRHEAEVAAPFDQLEDRFKSAVADDDVRLRALRASLNRVHTAHPSGDLVGGAHPTRYLGPLRSLRVLDLGCGKGRFAAALAADGAEVIGLDRSAAMLASARGLDRVLASARRLPFASASIDGVVAVEVFEHLPVRAIGEVLREVRRVLRPGGIVAIVDKNAGSWNAQRRWLPNVLVKWIDEERGRWMYPSGGPVRERWFWPHAFAARLRRAFAEVRVEYLLSPSEADCWLFRLVPSARVMTLWSARVPGGPDV